MCYGKIKKESGKNKSKLRTIYPKSSLGSNFTGNYKKECTAICFPVDDVIRPFSYMIKRVRTKIKTS